MGNGKSYAILLKAVKIGKKTLANCLQFTKVFYRQHFLLYGMSTMWSTVLLTPTHQQVFSFSNTKRENTKVYGINFMQCICTGCCESWILSLLSFIMTLA